MAEVRKVYPDMFPEVYPGLLPKLDPLRPEAEWRFLFRPGWSSPEEHVGYALTEGKKVVAFVGLLFAEIQSPEGAERLCNVTSWIAEDEYRTESISLLLPIRKAREYTVTNMSGEPHVREIFKRFGFETLEASTTILRPPLSTKGYSLPKGVSLTFDGEEIHQNLQGAEAQVYEDHAPYAHHLLVMSDDGLCHCIYDIRRRRRLPTALFHHISNPGLFLRTLPGIRPQLLRRHRVVMAECDSRFLTGLEVPASFQIRREFPRLFKSSSLKPEQVPNLYSEVVLMNLE